MFGGEGEFLWCLDVMRVGVLFSSEGQVVWC